MQDMFINEAKKTMDTLSYRNERAMKFELFNSKFQNAVKIVDIITPIRSSNRSISSTARKPDHTREALHG